MNLTKVDRLPLRSEWQSSASARSDAIVEYSAGPSQLDSKPDKPSRMGLLAQIRAHRALTAAVVGIMLLLTGFR